MSIVYETGKMSALMNTDDIINEAVAVATSAIGSENPNWFSTWKDIYRDKFDMYCCLARDDAASNKLVGTYGFGDISQYEILTRDRYPWVNTMRDAIVAKGIDEAKVDAAASVYVHADYTGQKIASTMIFKRAAYQIARGITHSVSFSYESSDIKTWASTRPSAEEMGVDGDNNKIYLIDLREITE